MYHYTAAALMYDQFSYIQGEQMSLTISTCNILLICKTSLLIRFEIGFLDTHCTVTFMLFIIWCTFSELISYTGNMADSVPRAIVLGMLSRRFNQPGIVYWGPQCNKAVQALYPNMEIRRKGRSKVYPLSIQQALWCRDRWLVCSSITDIL